MVFLLLFLGRFFVDPVADYTVLACVQSEPLRKNVWREDGCDAAFRQCRSEGDDDRSGIAEAICDVQKHAIVSISSMRAIARTPAKSQGML